MVIGNGDEQPQRVPVRHQRGRRVLCGLVHVFERLVDPVQHLVTTQRVPRLAALVEQRRPQLGQALSEEPADSLPPHPGLAVAEGQVGDVDVEELFEVGVLYPQVLELILRQPTGECLGQNHPVDTARGGA